MKGKKTNVLTYLWRYFGQGGLHAGRDSNHLSPEYKRTTLTAY